VDILELEDLLLAVRLLVHCATAAVPR
jgi:hypothetical protein